MNNIRDLLPDYINILNQEKYAKYLISKNIPALFDKSDLTDNLWRIHNDLFKKIKLSDYEPEISLLDLKIELASRIFKKCNLCENKCNVDRNITEGKCGVKQSKIASEFLHIGEERILVPSHTIFFSGCTFNCVFCQNWDISQKKCGVYIEPSKLVDIINSRKKQGSRNVNWVGGEPTPNILYIFKTLKKMNGNLPQIWNSNIYCSLDTMNLLNGVFDVYLTDFKYGNNKCAKKLSQINKYFEIVSRNHKIAYENGEIILRHLVMPNHLKCCSKPILDWIIKNIPNCVVNIMAQYRPEYKAFKFKEISHSITMDEFHEVKNYANKIGINQI
jgi:putative pyruvate formate lyase activating enzyme